MTIFTEFSIKRIQYQEKRKQILPEITIQTLTNCIRPNKKNYMKSKLLQGACGVGVRQTSYPGSFLRSSVHGEKDLNSSCWMDD